MNKENIRPLCEDHVGIEKAKKRGPTILHSISSQTPDDTSASVKIAREMIDGSKKERASQTSRENLQMAALMEEIQNKSEVIENLAEKVSVFQVEVEDWKFKNHELQQESKRKENMIKELQEENRECKLTIKGLHVQAQLKGKKVIEDQDDRQNLECECYHLNNELAQITKKISEKQKELADIDKEYYHIKDKYLKVKERERIIATLNTSKILLACFVLLLFFTYIISK